MARAIPKRTVSDRREYRKAHDQWRGPASQRGYDHDWAKVANACRERDGGLCQQCLRDGGLGVAMEQLSGSVMANPVDHIIPIHVRPEWRLEELNCQTLCQYHNAVKRERDNAKYGSPGQQRISPEQQRQRVMAQELTLESVTLLVGERANVKTIVFPGRLSVHA